MGTSIRAAWNGAPWARDAVGITASRMTTMTSSFDEIVEALRALAADPNADPEQARKAEAMLKTISLDRSEPADRRNRAYKASQRVEEKRKLDERMGIRRRATVHRDGVNSVFPTLTPDEARAFLARKAAG